MSIPEIVLRSADDASLVGRQEELDRLTAAIDRPDADASRVVLVSGEAGIGKSRLLDSAAAAVAEAGWFVLAVQADELDRAVPYAGLRHAIEAAAHRCPDELRSVAEHLVAMLDVGGQQPLAAIHAAASSFFAAMTHESPTLVALDDLEQLDDDSIVLVARLLRLRERHPLVVAANLRTHELARRPALGAFVDRARRDGSLDELSLGPLSADAVRELVAGMLATPPSSELLSAVQRSTGGNPFFIVQAVLNVADAPAPGTTHPTPGHGTSTAFPDDRRRAFLDRVLRVAPDARRLGRAVALIGAVGPSRIELAASLAGLTAADADEAFDVLVQRRILRTTSDGGYRLAHQLVREALYQEIGPAERWRWHRIAAERLRALPPTPATDMEVAAHVREVAEPGDDRAIEALSRAAEHACATAPRSSVGWFESALALTPPGDPRRAVLSSRLARALLLAGRPQQAIDAGTEALAGLSHEQPRSRLATMVIDALVLVGSMQQAAELADAELVHDPHSVRLAAKAAHVHMAVDRLDDALADVRAVSAAMTAAAPSEQILALGHVARMRCMQQRFDELPALWSQMEELAQGVPAASQLAAYAAIAYTQTSAGEIGRASISLSRAHELLATVGWSLYRHDLAVAQAQSAAHLGDWSSALAIIESVENELDTAGSLTHRDTLHAVKVDILVNRGQWAKAQRAADHPLSRNPHSAAVQAWAHAGIPLLSGDHEAARVALERQLADGSTPQWLRPLLLSRLADAETDGGRPERAVELLREFVDGSLAVRVGRPTYVAVRLAYGRAARDAGALRDGIAVADAHDLALLRGRGRLLLGAQDLDAERNLSEAARIFQTLGAAPWRRRAVAELRARGLKIPRERARSDDLLTEAELQVARLVQQGRSNREIAMTVFLSVKTVEAYLSRIYAKTGCANRLELARAMDAGTVAS
ncbi:MAG: hypothetical protein V7607_2290 [Solirubrobacteraceae bacterium]